MYMWCECSKREWTLCCSKICTHYFPTTFFFPSDSWIFVTLKDENHFPSFFFVFNSGSFINWWEKLFRCETKFIFCVTHFCFKGCNKYFPMTFLWLWNFVGQSDKSYIWNKFQILCKQFWAPKYVKIIV